MTTLESPQSLESLASANFKSSKSPRSFIKKYWWLIILVVLVVGLVLTVIFLVVSKDRKAASEGNTNNQNNTGNSQNKPDDLWPDANAKYITAIPVDLTQILQISKYRSCAGHIRNGYNFDRELETSDYRSMKHYVLPILSLQGTLDKVKIYAPFDGTVANIYLEKDKQSTVTRAHTGDGIDLATPVDPNVLFGIGHLYFVKDFKVGDSVKAGELLGYAALGEIGNDFDLDLKGKNKIGDGDNSIEILGSIFDHMTDPVLAEFAKYGITPENTKFTKEYRDANPCYDDGDVTGSWPDNWVGLTQPVK